MNRYYIVLLGFLLPLTLAAQKKKKLTYGFKEVSNMVLDGDLSEWEGQLYAVEDLWSFGISVQDGKLYAAVQIKDSKLQEEALRDGILLNLSYSAKKKDGAMLIYPALDRERIRAMRQDEEIQSGDIRQAMLASVRGYYVQGFDRLVNGLLSFDNTYGLAAKAAIDSSGVMSYEAIIPLDLVKFEESDIAVQLGVRTRHYQLQKAGVANTRSAPVGLYGRQPSLPQVSNPYPAATDVWVSGKIK